MSGPASPRIGLHYRGTDLSMPLLDFARAGEERGFTSIYLPEHTHLPVLQRTRRPPLGHALTREEQPPDERLPPLATARAEGLQPYQRLWDPYVALAFVAATTSLRVGTCISLVGQHDAIALAKAVATLDQLSGGRFVLGVGQGWNIQEFEDHGRPAASRSAVLRETMLLMKAVWTDDVAEFAGEHLRLSPSYSWPKPLQRPHPPVLLGCRPQAAGFRHVVEWADGWIPQDTDPSTTLAADLADLRARWDDAGRDGAPHVLVMQRELDAESWRRAHHAYASLGVEEVLVDVPTDDAASLLPLLDRLAALVGQ